MSHEAVPDGSDLPDSPRRVEEEARMRQIAERLLRPSAEILEARQNVLAAETEEEKRNRPPEAPVSATTDNPFLGAPESDVPGETAEEFRTRRYRRAIGGRYDCLQKLGDGAYGAVYEAEDLETGKRVALKRVGACQTDHGLPTTVVREVSLLMQLQHPNIIQ